MRQHRSGVRWDGDPQSAASRRGEREGSSGLILDLPDQGNLPPRDRLMRLDGHWLAWSPPTSGQIVDDRVDGRLVYPAPPRRVRTVHRLRRLLDLATPPMLLFILLAAAQVSAMLLDARQSGDWTAPSAANLALRLGYACAATLLPVGVLIWGSAARRSYGLVLVGAIAWSTLPAIAGLVWWLVRRSPSLMDEFEYAAAMGVAASALIACIGPAIIALGLERARRSRKTSMLDMAKRVAVATVLVSSVFAGRLLSFTDAPLVQKGAGGLDALHLAGTVSGAAWPLTLACLLILAWSCLVAVAEGGAQARFWQCATAGATLLAAAIVYRIATEGNWNTAPEDALKLAGGALLLLAFASPVWSAARDAAGCWRGAPDEIFTWGDQAQPAGSEPIPMSTIVAVAAGTDHALAVDEHGRVGAWGDDSVGQTQVPEGLSDVVAVAAGDGFSLALRSDGTVTAWGASNLGQTEVPPGLAGVTAIAAGSGFALALTAEGAVVGWGDGGYGATPAPPGLAGVAAISAGEYHGLALLADGTIVAWGDNTYGQLDVPPGLGRATAISAGGDFCLALLADGKVAAWGDNTYGQLDVPAGMENVAAVSAGAFHAVALRADGDVVAWGGGGRRQGEGTHPWRLVDFKAVAAGDGFSLAIRAA